MPVLASATADMPRLRPAILDIIARAEASPESDEAYFLAQLREAISGLERPAAPFALRTRSPRPDAFGRIVTRYPD